MKYRGKLGKLCRYLRSPGLLATQEEIDAWTQTEVDALLSRMNELFDYYGINRDDWMALAIRLAIDNVPGMRTETGPRGGSDKWGGVLGRAQIKAEIDDMIRGAAPRKLTASSAAALLAKRPPWKSQLSGLKNPADALRKQYEQADDRWVKVWRGARAYELYEADPNRDIEAAGRAAGHDPGNE